MRQKDASGARLGAPFIVTTPPLEKEETEHLPERYGELLQIGRGGDHTLLNISVSSNQSYFGRCMEDR